MVQSWTDPLVSMPAETLLAAIHDRVRKDPASEFGQISYERSPQRRE